MTLPVPPIPPEDIEAIVRNALPEGISPWVVSHIRTGVPMAVGAGVTWVEHELARRYGWLPRIDSATVASAATFVAAYGYYSLVRQLERWRPKFGVLLGYPARPVY